MCPRLTSGTDTGSAATAPRGPSALTRPPRPGLESSPGLGGRRRGPGAPGSLRAVGRCTLLVDLLGQRAEVRRLLVVPLVEVCEVAVVGVSQLLHAGRPVLGAVLQARADLLVDDAVRDETVDQLLLRLQDRLLRVTGHVRELAAGLADVGHRICTGPHDGGDLAVEPVDVRRVEDDLSVGQ